MQSYQYSGKTAGTRFSNRERQDMEKIANGYSTSRNGRDFTLRDGITHNDSRRLSNSPDHKSSSDNGIIQVGNDGLEVALIQNFEDEDLDRMGNWAKAASIGAPASAFNAIEGMSILKGGLAFQSLEDIRIAFGVRGASRVLTHQLVRTRAAAFKQQSQRDCYYGDMPEFRMPESIWLNPVLRTFWIGTLARVHRAYNMAIDLDIPFEDARYILPEGTTNFILCEYSLRIFLELYAFRGCIMFQSEMVAVMRAMRSLLVEAHPYLEPHIKISCERIKKCTFQGEEPTAGTCDLPWARKDTNVLDLQESK